jgi:hypothetical protein
MVRKDKVPVVIDRGRDVVTVIRESGAGVENLKDILAESR